MPSNANSISILDTKQHHYMWINCVYSRICPQKTTIYPSPNVAFDASKPDHYGVPFSDANTTLVVGQRSQPSGPPLFQKVRSMTPTQVAAHLQVSERRVIKWLREGQLLGVRIDKQWRTSTLHLATFLEARANRATATAATDLGNWRSHLGNLGIRS